MWYQNTCIALQGCDLYRLNFDHTHLTLIPKVFEIMRTRETVGFLLAHFTAIHTAG